MALNWLWKDKMGEVVFENGNENGKYVLYQGNAFYIMTYEYQDEHGNNLYEMASYAIDAEHMKAMFKTSKNDVPYNVTRYRKSVWKLNAEYSNVPKIAKVLQKAKIPYVITYTPNNK